MKSIGNFRKLPTKKKAKKKVEVKLNVTLWRILIIGGIMLLFLPVLLSTIQTRGVSEEVETSQMLVDIKDGKVKEIEIENTRIFVTYQDGTQKISTKEEGENFSDLLANSGIDPSSVTYTVIDQSVAKAMSEMLSVLLPLGLMAVFFLFIIRSQSKGAQDIFSFGRSKAKLFEKGTQKVTFDDVAGVDDAKKELVEIVDFLKNPTKYQKIGARTPKGVLLFGPAGVGKTLLARAVAGEANVPFFSMAGSEFMEMLVGVGASRVRDLFKTAKMKAPSIIFIDEIDAIGRQRGRGGFVGGHDEREQTLNQILVEMDGFTPNDNVIIMAATNRGDLLDSALLRPGRFDRRITLDMPDKEGRVQIAKIHAKGKKFADGIKWEAIAERTVGYSGADIENMLNEAAINAARRDKLAIENEDVEEAATKVKLGPIKRRLQSEDDRRITAYHEAGHAIVTHFLDKTDSVHRISIVARGMSLGHTLIPPAADRTHETRSQLLQMVTAMLGGRAAEEVVFNEMTAGASNDIERATQVARAMVTDLGMSTLGPIDLDPQNDESRPRFDSPVSQAMQEKVDIEIKRIMDSAYKEAVAMVKKHRSDLDKVAMALLKEENLDKEQFEKIVGKKVNGNKN